MNKIRLLTFLTGLMLLVIGLVKIFPIAFQGASTSVYSAVVLIAIGGMMMIAVKKK
jgi:hypothetical protein